MRSRRSMLSLTRKPKVPALPPPFDVRRGSFYNTVRLAPASIAGALFSKEETNSMRYAIIQNGGKQYKAVEGQAIEVDRLDVEVGKKLDLTDVLLVSDGDKVMVGTPTLSGAKVAATVLAQDQGPKV